jgi:hypothetical protein
MDSMANNNKNGEIDLPIEFLNLYWPSGMPPQMMKLKVGALIILRNLVPKAGLLDGTKLVVIHLVIST